MKNLKESEFHIVNNHALYKIEEIKKAFLDLKSLSFDFVYHNDVFRYNDKQVLKHHFIGKKRDTSKLIGLYAQFKFKDTKKLEFIKIDEIRKMNSYSGIKETIFNSEYLKQKMLLKLLSTLHPDDIKNITQHELKLEKKLKKESAFLGKPEKCLQELENKAKKQEADLKDFNPSNFLKEPTKKTRKKRGRKPKPKN